MDTQLWRPKTAEGEQITAAILGNPSQTLLVFDFDGTLADIQRYPEDSRLNEEAAAAFEVIGPRVQGVAFITGRAAATMVELARLPQRRGLEHAQVLGQYGVERWDAESGLRTVTPPAAIPAALGDLGKMVEAAQQRGRNVEGIWLEDKGLGIGVHYRRSPVPNEVEEWLPTAVVEIGHHRGLIVEPGRDVVELRAFEVTKGEALAGLVAEVQPKVLVMAGDDLGDVPAFVEAHRTRTKGLTTANVVAGCGEVTEVLEYADLLCKGPTGVAAWLTHLAQELR